MRRLVLALIILSALVRARGIDRPWAYGTHDGWGGAFYSNIARNYLRYGYLETRFAPVVSTGRVPREERRYYLTHPPGIGLAVSMSFRAFGESEWAARLVPLLVSLANLFLVYRLAAKLWSESVGLLAAMILSAVPLGVIYGAHVDPQGPPVTFAALLLMVGYVEGKPLLAFGALGLGALFDWPIHYAAGLVAAHALFFERDKLKGLKGSKGRRWALWLPVGSLLLVLGFLGYAAWIAPRPEQNYLDSSPATAFLFWTGLEVNPGRIPGRRTDTPSPQKWLGVEGRRLEELVGIPILFLSLLGLALARRRGHASYLLLLFAFGAAHVLLFPLGAYVHDYWFIYLLPGIAVASAIALEALLEPRPKGLLPSPYASRGRVFVLAASAALCGYSLFGAARWMDNSGDDTPSLGKKLHEMTSEDEGVISLTPMDARDSYYADRRVRDGINSTRLFREVLTSGAVYRYFVVPRYIFQARTQKPLFEWLSDCCPRLEVEDYYVFDLETFPGPEAALVR